MFPELCSCVGVSSELADISTKNGSVANISFPYTIAPGPLGECLEKLKTLGVPEKIDTTYLKQIGFGSSNHRPFVSIMKHVDLLDGNGTPTERYRKGLRGGPAGRKVVAEGIRAGYRELFSTYPNAQDLGTSDLSTFMSTHSDLGEKALRSAVSTFQTLCKFADFAGLPGVDAAGEDGNDDRSDANVRGSGGRGGAPGAVTINVNISLSVDATSDPDVYDAFFAAMAKHIRVLDGSSSNAA